MTRVHDVVDTPLGAIALVAEDDELCGLYFDVDKRPLALGERVHGGAPVLKEAAVQIDAYFAGERRDFDLPLRMIGTPFQQRVWQELLTIPYGETTTYGEIAERIGKPTACRAVGAANGRNPVSLIVPCHRVIGSTGVLTGYGWGLDRKAWLLELERGLRP